MKKKKQHLEANLDQGFEILEMQLEHFSFFPNQLLLCTNLDLDRLLTFLYFEQPVRYSNQHQHVIIMVLIP